MRFKKRAPDLFAFAPLPRQAYEIAGTVEHKPLASGILSRLRAGVAYRDKVYTTKSQRIVHISRGDTWCSLRTLRQDYFAATGCHATRGEIVGAVKWLKRNGLIISDKNAFPETNGRYGKIFSLSDNVLAKDEDMVDVIREHRLFTYGPIKDYRFSGRRVEYDLESFTKERYEDNSGWRRGIEQNGFDNAAYTTLGQWRFPEKGDPNAPVFVPWIVVDIDRVNLLEAHEDTMMALMDFDSVGFDYRSMYPGFSGSKGFHVMLSTGKLGYPIFKSSYDAMEVIREFLREITDVEFDLAVCNPMQLYRVAGSRNLKSGLYKRMYTLPEFMDTSLDEIFKNAVKPTSWSWPRYKQEVEDEMIEVMRTGANKVLKQRATEHRTGSKNGYNGIGPTLKAIIDGIVEGDTFGNGHTGRHKAAFILSMFMLEHPKQCEAVRVRLGINGRHDFDNPDCAFSTLEYWYQNRTQKVTDEIKLKEPFNSAQRTLARKYGRT